MSGKRFRCRLERGSASAKATADTARCSGCSRPVCACELAEELRASLDAGAMTERFAVLAEEVARGWYSQKSTSGWAHAVDDVMGLFRLRLVRDWGRADPERNVHAFLTQMVRFAGMDWQRKHDARRKREACAQ